MCIDFSSQKTNKLLVEEFKKYIKRKILISPKIGSLIVISQTLLLPVKKFNDINIPKVREK